MPRVLRISPEMAGVPAAAPLARMGPTPGYDVAARAFSGLAHTVAQTGGELLRIQAALQAEDAKLDMQQRFNQLKLDFGLREAELRDTIAMPEPTGATATAVETPVGLGLPAAEAAEAPATLLPALVQPQPPARLLQPKDYAATFGAEIDRMAEDSARGLKYPGMERHYRAQIAGWVGQQKVEALNQGIKLQHASLVLTDGLAARDEAKTAVYGATPEIRAAADASRANRLQSFVARGIYSGEKAAEMWEKYLTAREDGTIERDWASGSATVKNLVLGNLKAGRYEHLDPGAQRRKADELEKRESVSTEKLEKAMKQARDIAASEADKMLTDLVAEGDVATARGVLAEARSRLTDERYHQWMERLNKPSRADSDPAAQREMIPAVYNSSNNPAEVDKRLRALYAQGLVSDKDMQTWGGHLETRLNRLTGKATADQSRNESRLRAEQTDVEQRIRDLTTVNGAASPVLDALAQDARNWALRDMDRNSPLYGKGNERPMDWLKRKEPEILARVAQAGRTRLKTLDDSRPAWMKGAATDGATPEAVQASKQLLQQNRNRFRSEADYIDQARALMEKEAIIREMQRFQPARPSGGTQTPAAPASSNRPPGMGR